MPWDLNIGPSMVAVLCIVFSVSSVSAERLYRWKDDNGKVHYSDRMPSDYQGYAREELNEQGISVRSVPAARSAEQVELEAELEFLRSQQQRLIAEQAERDQVLLRTFGNEEELLVARESRLAAVDINLQITHSNLENLNQRLIELERSAANYELTGRPAPTTLLEQMTEARQKIEQVESELMEKRAQREEVERRFEADLKRFRELKTRKLVRERPTPPPKPASKPLISVVDCEDQPSCEKAWSLAQVYVKEHATTPFQIVTDEIILTGEPARDKDVSLIVSRIPEKGNGAKLFLDVRCNDSLAGQEFCQSRKVAAIKLGFQAFVYSRLP